MSFRMTGLVAAVFTPMRADGSLNLDQAGPIVDQLIGEGIGDIFVCGSTGEWASLTTDERMKVAEAFIEAAKGRLPVVVHVGHNSLAEAHTLATHAQRIGVDAISAAPPSYFKPPSCEVLVECLAHISAGAPELPFYYYNIPSVTGVDLDMLELLRLAADRITAFAGIKYTAATIDEYQALLGFEDGRFDILHGRDEMLLAGLSVGATGAIGTTYNFAAPLYVRLLEAFDAGDLAKARRCQARSVDMIRICRDYGGQTAFKAIMGLVGLDCGPNRLPQVSLADDEKETLRGELESIGFFQWARPN